MKDNLSRYTLRIDQALLDKLGYIRRPDKKPRTRAEDQKAHPGL